MDFYLFTKSSLCQKPKRIQCVFVCERETMLWEWSVCVWVCVCEFMVYVYMWVCDVCESVCIIKKIIVSGLQFRGLVYYLHSRKHGDMQAVIVLQR